MPQPSARLTLCACVSSSSYCSFLVSCCLAHARSLLLSLSSILPLFHSSTLPLLRSCSFFFPPALAFASHLPGNTILLLRPQSDHRLFFQGCIQHQGIIPKHTITYHTSVHLACHTIAACVVAGMVNTHSLLLLSLQQQTPWSIWGGGSCSHTILLLPWLLAPPKSTPWGASAADLYLYSWSGSSAPVPL